MELNQKRKKYKVMAGYGGEMSLWPYHENEVGQYSNYFLAVIAMTWVALVEAPVHVRIEKL